MIAFISGHLDLTPEEFNEHYMEKIKSAILRGHSFIVGDARGADTLAQNYLALYAIDFTCYHMFESPRNFVDFLKTANGSSLIGGFTSDKERDEAMTLASDYDIAWVREGRKSSGTAQNIKRRAKIDAEIAEKRTKEFQFITKPLSEYHTKQLLGMRRALDQAWSEYEYPTWYNDLNMQGAKPNVTREELYAELAKRPHIPNKKEGKALRREAAKRKV